MRAITQHLRRFKRGKRGMSTVIVAMLSLVLLVIVVSNVVLWSYQMNQADWERMQEQIDIIDVENVQPQNWIQHPSEVRLGGLMNLVNGGISNLATDDGSYMTFNSYDSGARQFDYVDNNLSDVDSSANKGTHSNFTAQQQETDLFYDVLTEQDTGVSSTFGSSIGDNFTTIGADQMCGSVFMSPTGSQGGTISGVAWYGRKLSSGTGNSKAIIVLESTKEILAISDVVTFSNALQERTNTFSSPPTISANTSYILMMIFDVPTRLYYSAGNPNHGNLDTTNNYTLPSNPTDATQNNNQYRIRASYSTVNYQLDLEVQWTNAEHNLANSQLCIYGGMMNPENIRVDVWTGSEWQTIITSLESGWNNVSVSSYLTSQAFTVRLKGQNESNDIFRDSWSIGANLLHVWTDEYTAEVEFTGVSNTESWTYLNWTTNTALTVSSVSVTIQLYNFTSGAYQDSGYGYTTFTSSAAPNTDENSTQMTSIKATDFRNATGFWKIKIKGVKSVASAFDLKADFVQFQEQKAGGTQLTLENGGSLTAHITSIWITNSVSHQRYVADMYINSGETWSQTYPDMNLPSGICSIKVATERGNMAVLSID